MEDREISIEGPLLDQETGERVYSVTGSGGETTFGLAPVDVGGVTQWILRVGADTAFPTDPGFEPYETEDEAYQAGIRASKAALQQQRS